MSNFPSIETPANPVNFHSLDYEGKRALIADLEARSKAAESFLDEAIADLNSAKKSKKGKITIDELRVKEQNVFRRRERSDKLKEDHKRALSLFRQARIDRRSEQPTAHTPRIRRVNLNPPQPIIMSNEDPLGGVPLEEVQVENVGPELNLANQQPVIQQAPTNNQNQPDPQANQAPPIPPQVGANQNNQNNQQIDPNIIILQNRPASAPNSPQARRNLRFFQGVPFLNNNQNPPPPPPPLPPHNVHIPRQLAQHQIPLRNSIPHNAQNQAPHQQNVLHQQRSQQVGQISVVQNVLDRIADTSEESNLRMASHFSNLLGHTVKNAIPTFTGTKAESISQWFADAKRVAISSGWNYEQRKRFFIDRLSGVAQTYNDSLNRNLPF